MTEETPEQHGHPSGDRGKNYCMPGFRCTSRRAMYPVDKRLLIVRIR